MPGYKGLYLRDACSNLAPKHFKFRPFGWIGAKIAFRQANATELRQPNVNFLLDAHNNFGRPAPDVENDTIPHVIWEIVDGAGIG